MHTCLDRVVGEVVGLAEDPEGPEDGCFSWTRVRVNTKRLYWSDRTSVGFGVLLATDCFPAELRGDDDGPDDAVGLELATVFS